MLRVGRIREFLDTRSDPALLAGADGGNFRPMASTPYERGSAGRRAITRSLTFSAGRPADFNQSGRQKPPPSKRRPPMHEKNHLGQMILKHWREHCPQMVRTWRSRTGWTRRCSKRRRRTGDLLYELVSVKKMDYQAAWELASAEWALPPSEDRPPSSLPRTLETEPQDTPVPRLPDNRSPPDRAGRAEGKGPRQHRGHPHAETDRRRKPRGDAKPKKPCSPATAAGARCRMSSIPIRRSDWQEIARDVRRTLTPEEYDSARASTPNAHFTSPMVIEALWQAHGALRAWRGRADP